MRQYWSSPISVIPRLDTRVLAGTTAGTIAQAYCADGLCQYPHFSWESATKTYSGTTASCPPCPVLTVATSCFPR
jgi:hypothetical protein